MNGKDDGWNVIAKDEKDENVSNKEEVKEYIFNNDKNKSLLNSELKEKNNNYKTIIVNHLNNKALIPIIADQESDKTQNQVLATAISGKIKENPLTVAKDVQDNCKSVAATNLVLSQTLSSENSSDDMTYNNMVEIVKTSNSVGRRMAYSVVGNQNPLEEPAEIDADDADEVTILPPFGQKHYIYYILSGAIAGILIGGILLIKKKVFGK